MPLMREEARFNNSLAAIVKLPPARAPFLGLPAEKSMTPECGTHPPAGGGQS
jgi:hypothetical protein